MVETFLAAVASALHSRAHQQRRDRLEQIVGQLLDVVQPDLPTAAPPAKAPLAYGDLTFDVSGFRASLRGRALDLTPTEFRLLLELTRAPGVALSYSNLVQSACGYTCARHEAREIIGAHVLNLRKKLGVAPETALYIESVRGVSYRLIPAAE